MDLSKLTASQVGPNYMKTQVYCQMRVGFQAGPQYLGTIQSVKSNCRKPGNRWISSCLLQILLGLSALLHEGRETLRFPRAKVWFSYILGGSCGVHGLQKHFLPWAFCTMLTTTMCFQFSMLNFCHPYGSHLKGQSHYATGHSFFYLICFLFFYQARCC